MWWASALAKGIHDQIRVMVGGAPVSAEFANDIGADAFDNDAAEAVVIARRFIPR
jgi:methanogenic corrinoid protein MtbC1